MRTTLVLDDPIFEKAKKKSAEMGVTLSELTTMALRDFLISRTVSTAKKKHFLMPVVGDASGIYLSPIELARLRDDGR